MMYRRNNLRPDTGTIFKVNLSNVDEIRKSCSDYTIVAEAIHQNRPDVVRDILGRRELIIRGRRNRIRNETTLLHLAAKYGTDDVVQILLEKGFEVNAQDGSDQTPLHHSIRRGHQVISELLIGYGANVNICDCWGRTPLHHSIIAMSSKLCVQLLLDQGADVEARDRLHGCTPLDYVKRRDYPYIDILLANAKIRPDNWKSKPARVIVTRRQFDAEDFIGRSDVLSQLEDRNYDEASLGGERPCGSAKWAWDEVDELSDEEELELSVEEELEPDLVHLPNSLSAAIRLMQPSMVRLFLDCYPDSIREWSNTGQGPVHQLIRGRIGIGKRILDVLLQHDVDVNFQNILYETPLDWAFRMGHDWVRMLIISGADINIGDSIEKFRNKWARKFMTELIHKLHMAGSFVSDYHLYQLQRHKIQFMNAPWMYRRVKVCKKEVNVMKQHNLVDGLSLHKVFITENLEYQSDGALMSKLELVDFKKYVEYGDLLAGKLKRDKSRYQDLNLTFAGFNLIALVRGVTRKDSPKYIPYDIVNKIIAQLDRFDRQSLKICGQKLKKQLHI